MRSEEGVLCAQGGAHKEGQLRVLGGKPAQSWQPGESRLLVELACRETDLKNLAFNI